MSAWRQVEDAIDRISDRQGRLVSHAETPWNSATFEGTRHTLTLDFDGEDAVLIGEAIIEELPRGEIKLSGHLVCDAKIMWCNRQIAPCKRMTLQLQLLLVDRPKEAA